MSVTLLRVNKIDQTACTDTGFPFPYTITVRKFRKRDFLRIYFSAKLSVSIELFTLFMWESRCECSTRESFISEYNYVWLCINYRVLSTSTLCIRIARLRKWAIVFAQRCNTTKSRGNIALQVGWRLMAKSMLAPIPILESSRWSFSSFS